MVTSDSRIRFMAYENAYYDNDSDEFNEVTDHVIKVDIKPLYNTVACLNLKKEFANILACKEFSDVTLIAKDGIELKAHKAILCGRSPVFAAMFRNNFQENKTNLIRIDDMVAEVIEEMLKFLYTGGDVLETFAKDLFIAANKYSLLDLQIMCENILINTMEIATVADILLLADRLANARLKTNAVQFIVKNIKTVTETEGWKKLCETDHDLSRLVLDKTEKNAKRMRYNNSSFGTYVEPATGRNSVVSGNSAT
ncbi:speckle-type POZ protein-like [Musca autumnalis]|uniref:speckle-type POZ protein-like n=1 Tax=Musca autumnalis TaxID=221902 RepID=UPI003CEC2079